MAHGRACVSTPEDFVRRDTTSMPRADNPEDRMRARVTRGGAASREIPEGADNQPESVLDGRRRRENAPDDDGGYVGREVVRPHA